MRAPMRKLILSTVLALMNLCPANEIGRQITLKPVTGGTLSAKMFAESVYSLAYAKDKATEAVLLKFDYSALPTAQFGTLFSAKLKFRLNAVANPAGWKICPAWIDNRWEPTRDVNWNSDYWSSNTYTKIDGYFPRKVLSYRNKYPVFTYSIDKIGILHAPPAADGEFAIELTDAMREKLYSGREEYGLALLFFTEKKENPASASGSAKMVSAPELELTFFGAVPANDRESIDKRALKLYPSANLPPVKEPYIFLLCAYGRTFQDIFWNELKTFNTDGVYLRPEYEQRGILCLKAVEMPNEVTTKRKKLKDAFLQDFRASTGGVAIDEWQSKDTARRGDPQAKLIGSDSTVTVDNAIAAIHEYKKEKPSAMIGIYWRGEDSLQPLAKDDLPDLIFPEVYTSFVETHLRNSEIGRIEAAKHMEWAKEDGYYEKIIPLHGCLFAASVFPENNKRWTRERLEHDIKYVKEKYPELIGQGFFCSLGERTQANIEAILPLLKWTDETLYEVYIKPAPELVIIRPVFEAELTRKLPHVKIKARAAGAEGRKIIQYRWFIDNRLVAETATDEYLWDIRGEQPGKHMITVHVVDEKYYRKAAQIPVSISH